MSEENGPDDTSGPPGGEEEREEDTRRVRPLFRFGRRNSKRDEEEMTEEAPEEEPPEETVQDGPAGEPVRPVRVVKFVPQEDDGRGEQPAFVEEAVPGEDQPFAVEEGQEQPFVAEEGQDQPFVVEEGQDQPFVVEEGQDQPFVVEGGQEQPFVVEEGTPTPYEGMEETRWSEPVHDSISTQEEAEATEEMELRSEESPTGFETTDSAHAVPAERPEETKPHYHKYLKPDEDLIKRPQAKGPATGFDRDMDADAGEIDFGIDLIDPSERRKKKKRPPRDKGPAPKKGVGGHDFDAEVDTRGMGSEVGVDYQKRRKRRL